MALQAGARLGPYEIIAPVGAGAMGEVYRARDSRLKREVAIKILPSTEPDLIRRFEQEAEAAGRLNHPNLLAVYDVGVDGEVPYLVSELLIGDTLRATLNQATLSITDAIHFAIQLARGLSAAHARGIVHRDLKPDNVFVTSDRQIKILDFGLAKLTGASGTPDTGNQSTMAALTEPGMVLGTAGYMSPEQVRGGEADHRSDIFAFGAVLYEMLSGRRAFGRPTAVEAMTAVLTDTPPAVALVNPRVPAELDRILGQCLAKQPADRFQSARDLELALERLSLAGGRTEPASARPRMTPAWSWAIGAIVLVAVAAGVFVMRRPATTAATNPAAIHSLAVLPLGNFSSDPEQEYFSDGMTDTLIADLARISGLRVISRTSAMTYKASRTKLTQIARELAVDAIIEGSVTRVGDRVRITAQLIDGVTEQHLWSQTYERSLSDVLAMQSEVARAIAAEIRITLSPSERAVLTTGRVLVPEAHEAHLRGRFALAKGNEDAINSAIAYFKKATQLDPAYAEPWAGLADAYTALRSVYAPPHAVMPLAKAAAARALELDPILAAAHVSMGGVLMFYEFDWAGAERELRAAITLSPNLAEAHDYYGQLLASRGRHDEAQKEGALARQLDPLSVSVLMDTGWIHYLGRQYDKTIELDLKALELDPNYWPAMRDLGLAYEKVGRYPEAVATLLKARALDANPSILEMLAGAYTSWGKTVEARAVLGELEERAKQAYVCPYELATVHAGLGNRDAALAKLEEGLNERADCMPWASSDPKLDSLRDDPRFKDLIRRLGIPAR
jgi:TolB-like protein